MHLRVVCVLLFGTLLASAQTYHINTIAGFGTFGGDGGPASAAVLGPGALVADANGNLYVSDPVNFRIRKIDASGTIYTLVGQGYGGFSGDDGPSTAAVMSTAASLALDNGGNLYFTDDSNQRVREVTAAGMIATVAGNGTCGTVGAGVVATQAPLCDIESVAVDAQGRVYFASVGQIWMVAANGTLALIAGTGGTDHTGDNGPATAAQIGYPGSMAIDQTGNLYIADAFHFVIRKVTTDGVIHTVVTISDTRATGITVALDASGTLFYATGVTKVFKLVQGAPVVAATVGIPPSVPDTAGFLAIDKNGGLYVSSFSRRDFSRSAAAW